MFSVKNISLSVLLLVFFTGVALAQTEMELLENLIEGNREVKLSNGKKIVSKVVVPSFYVNNGYNLVWSDDKNRAALIRSLRSSYDEGLNPSDYHLETIELLNSKGYKKLSGEEKVDLDLMMTDGLVQYGAHLNSGKVSQSELRSEWDLDMNPLPENPDSLITVTLHNQRIEQILEELKPKTILYQDLKAELKSFRNIALKGGWPKIPEGETLKKGMTDERVSQIRKYLTITGDLPISADTSSNLYDEDLENAVKKYQYRFSLTQDGVVGKGVLGEMNVSVEDRINQIRVNLERSRWVLHNLSEDFLVVNIAGFYIKRFTNGRNTFYSRVIVGKNHHETPIFKDQLEYIELNPTWTLPYSIATRETLPKLKQNPGYLAANQMEIFGKNGVALDPASIDFSQYSRGNFPFTIRQKPGPHNALGEVKFMFPNQYSVYLHDTPSRSLFDRQDRAFSHGCIRLDRKWDLFLSLMEGTDWDQSKIDEVIASQKTTRVSLLKPIDIYLLYWTTALDDNQKVVFIRDVYNRDPAVLRLLDRPL